MFETVPIQIKVNAIFSYKTAQSDAASVSNQWNHSHQTSSFLHLLNEWSQRQDVIAFTSAFQYQQPEKNTV